MTSHFHNNKTGFTLLETLVAIAIMTVAVGAAFTMAQKSLMSSYTAKNQATGYFLAAEGLELVRTVRDNIALYNTINGANLNWIQPLAATSSCEGPYGCDIDAASPSLYISSSTQALADPSAVFSCDPARNASATSTGCIVKFKSLGGGSMYTSRPDTSLPSSIYTRTIHIDEVDVYGNNTKREATVTSRVSWLGGQSVSVTETINNWR